MQVVHKLACEVDVFGFQRGSQLIQCSFNTVCHHKSWFYVSGGARIIGSCMQLARSDYRLLHRVQLFPCAGYELKSAPCSCCWHRKTSSRFSGCGCPSFCVYCFLLPERLRPRFRLRGRGPAGCLGAGLLGPIFCLDQMAGSGSGDHSARGILSGSLIGAFRSPQVRGISGSHSVFLVRGFRLSLGGLAFLPLRGVLWRFGTGLV